MENEEIKLNDHTQWQGEYKGVRFEIVKWKREAPPEFDMGYTWNYYLIVKPRKIIMGKPLDFGGKKEVKEVYVDYYKMYRDVEMHGGITYWARIINSRNKEEVDRIGCDYAHAWDCEEGSLMKHKENKVEWVMRDVKESIDKLPSDLFFKQP